MQVRFVTEVVIRISLIFQETLGVSLINKLQISLQEFKSLSSVHRNFHDDMDMTNTTHKLTVVP